MNRWLAALFVVTVAQSASVGATIVTNGVELGSGGFVGDYNFIVYRDPSLLGNYTGVWMDFGRDATSGEFFLTGTNSLLDEGSNWYLVDQGDVLSSKSIAAHEYPLIVGVRGGTNVFNTVSFLPPLLDDPGIFSREFYLGIGPPSSAWGWAKLGIRLVFNEYHLTLLESALAFDANGIVVGTHTLVPEPSSCLMPVALAAVAIANRRRVQSLLYVNTAWIDQYAV
jgi:hypothetical protein